MVGLRTPDRDGSLLEIEIPQLVVQSLERGLASNKAEVIGLELVCCHVHLVALTMVDENVPHAPVTEHLKVLGVLIDVEHNLQRLL